MFGIVRYRLVLGRLARCVSRSGLTLPGAKILGEFRTSIIFTLLLVYATENCTDSETRDITAEVPADHGSTSFGESVFTGGVLHSLDGPDIFDVISTTNAPLYSARHALPSRTH